MQNKNATEILFRRAFGQKQFSKLTAPNQMSPLDQMDEHPDSTSTLVM